MNAPITRRAAVGGLTATLLADGAATYAAAAPRPDVIVILADDLGYGDPSITPGGRIPTPHLERLAAEGVRCETGYSSAPVCAPSRAGLMTGRYQQRFGFEYNNGPAERDLSQGLGLDVGERTIADLLRRAGYRTGAVGKWHLGSADPFYPTNRGFDEFVGFLPGASSYIDPRVPGVHVSYGAHGDELLQNPQVLQRLTRRVHDRIVEGPERTVVHDEERYLTDVWGERAADFVRRHAASPSPYFLYVAFNAPHTPHMVTDEYYARFADAPTHQVRVYSGMIAALDDAIGRILRAVDEGGRSSDTLIVFGVDHGCAMYVPGLCRCVPLRGGKLSHYEGGTRVPFVVRWPRRLPSGTVYPHAVSLLDVLPTCAAAAGASLPADRVYDGVDLVPYLRGARTHGPHETLFWRREPLRSVRHGDWKLWEAHDPSGVYGDYTFLFDLRADPRENRDLSAREPDVVAALRSLLNAWSAAMIPPRWPSRPPITFDVCGRTFTLPI